MRISILLIFLFSLLGCNSQRFLWAHIDINEKYPDILSKIQEGDTAIVYFDLSAQRIRGGEKNIYLLRKFQNRAIVDRVSNLTEYKTDTLLFNWNYLLTNFERLKEDSIVHLSEDGLVTKKYIPDDQHDFDQLTKVLIKLNEREVEYAFYNSQKQTNENNARVILVDKIRSAFYAIYFKPLNYKLKPRGYKISKPKWQLWDEKNLK